MNDRIYIIDLMLPGRIFVTFNEPIERLEISRAPLKCDLAYMRDRFNAPIVFDREMDDYRIDKGF